MDNINNRFTINRVSNKPLNGFFILLCLLFLLSRIIYLDSDIPNWDISNYQPIDELYYTTTAFDLYHYHDWNHQILKYVPSDSSSENLLGNILCFSTLSIFGNNYYGLRMASVLASFGVFILMFFILKNYLFSQKQFDIESKSSFYLVIIITLLYLLFDFAFLMAGRVAEPTIFRMLGLVFIIWVLSLNILRKYFFSNSFVFLAGFFAVVSVFFIYPTNAFIVPAIWLICFSVALKTDLRKAIVQTFLFIVGGLIAFAFYELTLRLAFDKSFIDSLLNTYSIFTDRVAIPNNSDGFDSIRLFKIYVYNIFATLSTNLFRFNPIILATFASCLPIFIYKLIKHRNINDIFLASLLGFFLLQSLIINDYPYRKLIIMLPMVLLLIAYSITEYKNFIIFVRKNVSYYILYFLYVAFCVMGAVGILLINSSKNFVRFDFLVDGINIILPILIFQIILILIYLTNKKIKDKYLISIIIILIMLPNMFLSVRYIYSNPTYSYRDTMIYLSNYIDDKIVAGGMGHGFRLYNTSVPIVNPYGIMYSENGMEKYNSLVDQIRKENDVPYILLYTFTGKKAENAFCASHEVYYGKLDLVRDFELKNIVRGEKPDIGLYKFR